MMRRALLLTPLVAKRARAAEFAPTLDFAGHRLVRNGTATRTWSALRIPVYDAALYLERSLQDAAAIQADPGAKLVLARYRRAVALPDVRAAWEATFTRLCACPLPAAFHAWLRALAPGDTETQFFLPDRCVASGPGRPDATLDPVTARTLLAAWIGPAVPPETLRRGLLGLT